MTEKGRRILRLLLAPLALVQSFFGAEGVLNLGTWLVRGVYDGLFELALLCMFFMFYLAATAAGPLFLVARTRKYGAWLAVVASVPQVVSFSFLRVSYAYLCGIVMGPSLYSDCPACWRSVRLHWQQALVRDEVLLISNQSEPFTCVFINLFAIMMVLLFLLYLRGIVGESISHGD